MSRLSGLRLLALLWLSQARPVYADAVPTPVAPSAPPDAAASQAPTNRRVWPHFARPAFDWDIDPLASYRLTNAGTIAESASSFGVEAGVVTSLRQMALRRRSQSLWSLNVTGGGAGGQLETTLTEAEGRGASKSRLNYYRAYADLETGFHYKSFRLLAGISRGILSYRTDEVPVVQDVTGRGTTGLRVLRWLSFHLDTVYRHVFGKDFADPMVVELVSWPHVYLELPKAHVELDIGPGATYAQESQLSEVASEGWVRFVFLNFKLIDILGYNMEGRARYIIRNSDPGLGYYATMKLPRDDLSSPPLLTAPSDTLTLSIFLNQFYRDFKVGYWANWVIFDYAHKYKSKSHTNKDSGFGVFLGYAL